LKVSFYVFITNRDRHLAVILIASWDRLVPTAGCGLISNVCGIWLFAREAIDKMLSKLPQNKKRYIR